MVVTVAMAALLAWAPAAGAHTAFESSDPADGSVVAGPVDEVVLTFTGESVEAGEGFVVLTPAGEVIEPDVLRSDDGRRFTLWLDPPLVAGEVAVRWMVRAADAHPIDGSFRFTTTAPAVPTDPPAATVPTGSTGPTGTTVPTGTAEEPAAPMTMDEFLAGDDGFDRSRPFGWVGRPLSTVGALGLIGLVALQVLTLREPAGRHRVLRAALMALSVGLAAGSVAEGIGLAVAESGWSTSAGIAMLLRLVGGLAAVSVLSDTRATGTTAHRVLIAAAGLVLASWAFDGHTVTEGNRALTTAVDLVHAAAGAVWAGGVLGLALLSRSERDRLVAAVVRFSVVATAALAVAGACGIVLAVTILDSFDGLWSTPWGRVLLAKTMAVGVAAGIGAYNHFVVVPALRSADAGRSTAFTRRLRSTLRIELLVLTVVAVLTASLVASAAV